MEFLLFLCVIAIIVLALKLNKTKTTLNFQNSVATSLQEDKSKLKHENYNLSFQNQKLNREIFELKSELEVLHNTLTTSKQKVIDLKNKNSELSAYQDVVDAVKKAKQIIFDAEVNATNLVVAAQREAEEIKSVTKENKIVNDRKILTLRSEAETLLSNAAEEAKKLIDEAKERAKEIAGDAYFALQNSRELTDTARAMKNVIEGYGHQYLIPAYGLLDDLAEGFSHTQAGAKLSFVRDKIRLMIKNNLAAQCDYTDQRRREMAIKFVLDAFNGKVETIFSKIKKDNYGILLQQLKDAYQLVNNNGTAFNNATITREYFNTRSQELKWAIAVNELKLLEQEEQRRIREQIREEEKARREIEKALREAQKEEETLKKLIEKAQKEVLNATEEQKQVYEQRLLDLESKLEFAENKNQRALSMAQQTKAGNVYIISNIGSFGENVYKIGMTRRLEPLDRVRELGDASVPFSFDVHAMIFSDDAPALEKQLHRHFMLSQLNKINPRKEFFKVSLEQIRNEIEKLNFTVKWTMAAEAKHYRESLVIEKDMEQNPEAKAEWQKYQTEASAVITFDEEDLIQSSLN